jgi:hypothetical protein
MTGERADTTIARREGEIDNSGGTIDPINGSNIPVAAGVTGLNRGGSGA